MKRLLLLAALVSSLAPAVMAATAADAPALTVAELLANERLWPYHVSLKEPRPAREGARGVPARVNGVLIRLEPEGRARIDFGRFGVVVVPVEQTNALEVAARIRRGEVSKLAPNLTLAIGSKLMASDGDALAPIHFSLAAEAARGFLCVFADPSSPDFSLLARSLAPLHQRHEVWTVLVPDGGLEDPQVREALRAAGWPVPFVMSRMVESHREALVGPGASSPYLLLASVEGRLLYQGPFELRRLPRLRESLDARFGPGSLAGPAAP